MGLEFGKDVIVEEGAIIDVRGGYIGDRTIIRSGARIQGNSVVLGKECYLDHGAWIGGGSAYDSVAFLNAGDWLHMGWNSQINIARGVKIGHEVGIGIETKIFTHGAYLPIDLNFPAQWGPVEIGDRVWLPNAWVNPNVRIGSNVVVSARSLVTRDLPDGVIAGGIPAKVIREGCWPKENYLLLSEACSASEVEHSIITLERTVIVRVGDTLFDIRQRTIHGAATPETERMKEQLRRNGIRFRFTAECGDYIPWESVIDSVIDDRPSGVDHRYSYERKSASNQ